MTETLYPNLYLSNSVNLNVVNTDTLSGAITFSTGSVTNVGANSLTANSITTVTNSKVVTIPTTSGTADTFDLLGEAQTITGLKTFSTNPNIAAVTNGTYTETFQFTASDTIVNRGTTDTLTNKTLIANSTIIADGTTPTKELLISLSGASSSTSTTFTFAQTANRILTFPDLTDTVTTTTNTATFTNKTIMGGASSNVVLANELLGATVPSLTTGSLYYNGSTLSWSTNPLGTGPIIYGTGGSLGSQFWANQVTSNTGTTQLVADIAMTYTSGHATYIAKLTSLPNTSGKSWVVTMEVTESSLANNALVRYTFVKTYNSTTGPTIYNDVQHRTTSGGHNIVYPTIIWDNSLNGLFVIQNGCSGTVYFKCIF